MNKKIIMLCAIFGFGCNSKDDWSPQTSFSDSKLEHTEWGSNEVGSDSRGYWHEIDLGYPYPDGYACKSQKTLREDLDQGGGDFMYFQLGSWKATAGMGPYNQFAYVTNPEIRVFKLKSRCPNTGGWTTSYDAYEGIAAPDLGDSWSTKASETAGVASDNRDGFVGQYFAPSDATATLMVNYPDLDNAYGRGMFTPLIRSEADDQTNGGACSLHLYSYDAESTLYPEDFASDIAVVDPPETWTSYDGHSYTIHQYYDTDYEYVYELNHTISWGGGGRDYHALCESQESGTSSNDDSGDSGGWVTTTSTCSVSQEVPFLSKPVDTCTPGSAVFSVGPETFTPNGGKVPVIKELISGKLGPSARIYHSDLPVHQTVLANGEEVKVELGATNVTKADGSPLDLAFYSAYLDGQGEGVMSWDCSIETEPMPFVGEKHILKNVFQKQSLVVREIELGSSEGMVPAVAVWMPNRRDHVALPLRNGAASYTMDDTTFTWTAATKTLYISSAGFSQSWTAQ